MLGNGKKVHSSYNYRQNLLQDYGTFFLYPNINYNDQSIDI